MAETGIDRGFTEIDYPWVIYKDGAFFCKATSHQNVNRIVKAAQRIHKESHFKAVYVGKSISHYEAENGKF